MDKLRKKNNKSKKTAAIEMIKIMKDTGRKSDTKPMENNNLKRMSSGSKSVLEAYGKNTDEDQQRTGLPNSGERKESSASVNNKSNFKQFEKLATPYKNLADRQNLFVQHNNSSHMDSGNLKKSMKQHSIETPEFQNLGEFKLYSLVPSPNKELPNTKLQ